MQEREKAKGPEKSMYRVKRVTSEEKLKKGYRTLMTSRQAFHRRLEKEEEGNGHKTHPGPGPFQKRKKKKGPYSLR